MDSYDYIIVGAGSSGCVLANRLSADSAVSVLLVEGGPKDSSAMIAMPRGMGKLHVPGNPNVKFYEASKGGNRPVETWYKGTTVGGSSSINGMVYVRGAPMDYDGWAAVGCTGWGWDEVGPCFVELEDHELGADATAVRGAGGPLKISMHPTHDVLSEAVLTAGEQNGVTRVADINDVRVVRDGGLGYLPSTTWKGERFSAAKAFLHPIRSRANLTVVTGTQVLRIVLNGTRATAIEVSDATGNRTIGAAREIIVAAGAIESPKLLMLSGIGPAAQLAAFGIPVVKDSPDVGRNLREHRYLPVMFRVTQGSLNHAFQGFGLFKSVVKYFLARKGPLTHSAHEVAGFIKTNPDLPHADVQLGIGLYSIKRTASGYGIDDKPGLTIGGYYTRPGSQGEIRLASADPAVPPHIDANYLDDPEDRAHGIAMLRWIRRMAAQPALKPYIVEETTPGPDVQTDDEIVQALIERGSTAFHVSSTCRMGADEHAVLDPELRVRGVDGLRVCDTSIFPTLVSGNTNAPAMAVALRLAHMMTGT